MDKDWLYQWLQRRPLWQVGVFIGCVLSFYLVIAIWTGNVAARSYANGRWYAPFLWAALWAWVIYGIGREFRRRRRG